MKRNFWHNFKWILPKGNFGWLIWCIFPFWSCEVIVITSKRGGWNCNFLSDGNCGLLRYAWLTLNSEPLLKSSTIPELLLHECQLIPKRIYQIYKIGPVIDLKRDLNYTKNPELKWTWIGLLQSCLSLSVIFDNSRAAGARVPTHP